MADVSPTRTPEVLVSADPVAAAAELLASALTTIAGEHGRVRCALPGGSAAAAAPLALKLLATRGFDFTQLALTWVDERCVALSSPDSNRGALALGASPGTTLPLFIDGERPSDAVSRVDATLMTTFDGALDVVLLGMGGDGHIASLFAGRPPLEGRVAHIDDSPKPPANRITLTRALLATAKHTILLAAGEAKRSALAELAAGNPDLPATGLPGLIICTDLDSTEQP